MKAKNFCIRLAIWASLLGQFSICCSEVYTIFAEEYPELQEISLEEDKEIEEKEKENQDRISSESHFEKSIIFQSIGAIVYQKCFSKILCLEIQTPPPENI